MKNILMLVLMLFAVFSANAQKIHWLLFIDTDDSRVGEIDKRARAVVKDHFVNVVNSVLVQEGYETTPISDNYGSLVNSQNCMNIVSNLRCNSKDIIVFYYIGHGGRNPDETVAWPMMNMGEDVLLHPERMIPLESVHNILKGKGARLTITIGMCCNSDEPLVPRRGSIGFGANYGHTYLSGASIQTIKKLFLQNRGDLIVTAAQPKQIATCGENEYGGDKYDIDIFTHFFLYNFESNLEDSNLTWEKLFDLVSSGVWEDSKNTQYPQRPFYKSSLSSVAPPVRQIRPEPDPVNPDNTVANVLNMIASNFDYVTDATSNNLERRQDKANELTRYFASDAKVKVYSQDGNYNVDSEPIDIYLRRMRTSGILMKVVPIDYRASGGKITELKVKEYYKR